MSFAGVWLRASRGAASHELAPALQRLCQWCSSEPVAVSSPRDDIAFGYTSSLRERQLHTPPVVDCDSGSMIVGDVRLDNRVEIACAVAARGDESDLALILRAHRRWGEDCAERLLGDFAFAIWDERAREVTLVRDACGVRPLFYTALPNRVVFSSRADILLSVQGVPHTLDERAVLDYLGEFPEDEQSTLFSAVRRVPPAHIVRVGFTALRRRAYFDVAAVPPSRLTSDDECAAGLTEVLKRSISRRVPRGLECGVSLSGGLDSATVTCLAAEVRRGRGQSPIHSFSAIFPDSPSCDERSFQRAVVDQCRSNHAELSPNPTGRSADFATVASTFGDPAPIGLHWLTWPIAEAAARNGVPVLLTGVDGDRVVSHGGSLLVELARSRQFEELVRECLSVTDFSTKRKLRVLSALLIQAIAPRSAVVAWDRFDPRKRARYTEALRLLRKPGLARTGTIDRLRSHAVRPASTREAHVNSLKASNRNWDVELLDRLGAATGVEFRHPFFDREVVSFCVSLPGRQKRRGGYSRFVLRQAMSSFAPGLIRWRRADTGLDEAFEHWMGAWLRSWPQAGESLDNLSTWVDVARLRAEISLGHRRPGDFTWRCMVFSRWLEYFSLTSGPG